MAPQYWIIVATRDHVLEAARGGFVQAEHGKASLLRRMKPGDWVIYYSPRLEFDKSDKCQRFTAIARVAEGPIYQQDMGEGIKPFRRKAAYSESREVSILLLVPQLTFIKNKEKWGLALRYGKVKISEDDFSRISSLMLLRPAAAGREASARAT